MDALRQVLGRIVLRTGGPGLYDVTSEVDSWLREKCARDGLLTVFIRHTSASLVIQENADPDVRVDLIRRLQVLAPENAGYLHNCEGSDDMPAHIKSMLTATSLSIPVEGGRMVLGIWQALYIAEHRTQAHQRELVLQFLGTVDDP